MGYNYSSGVTLIHVTPFFCAKLTYIVIKIPIIEFNVKALQALGFIYEIIIYGHRQFI